MKRYFSCFFSVALLLSGCLGQVKPRGNVIPQSDLSRGKLALQSGDAAQAIVLFKKIISEKGDTREAPEANYLLGEAYKLANDNDNALATYQNTYSKYKKGPYVALALRKKGFLLRDMGKNNEAIESLKTAQEVHPVQFNFESCTYAIGHIYMFNLKDTDSAAIYFKKLLEKQPKNIHYEVKAVNFLAKIYYDKKEYNEALSYYQDLIDRFGWTKEAQEAVDKLDEIEEKLGL